MRRRLILVGVIIFIGVNYLLVFLDKENKVDRVAYVKEWEPAFQADMMEEVNKPGVLSAKEESHLYFSQETGDFQAFVIEEGSDVKAGDPLYTYRATNYYETVAALEQERAKLTGEISAVEQAISEMNRYQIPRTTQGSATADSEQPVIQIELPDNPVEADIMKEQYLIEKAKELASKKAELSSIEAQLTELESSGDAVTVESPYDGTVTEVSTELNAPIITIASRELHAEGTFTEAERSRIEEGLPVRIQVNEKAVALEGMLNDISESPEEVRIQGESNYPFHVTINEVEEETKEDNPEKKDELNSLLPGYHVNLSVITKESKDATVLFEKNLYTDLVWKMNENGMLVEQKVETGLHMDSMVEITEGMKAGEWAAAESESQFRNHATFITPLQWDGFTWKDITTRKYDHWSKYFVTGLLSR